MFRYSFFAPMLRLTPLRLAAHVVDAGVDLGAGAVSSVHAVAAVEVAYRLRVTTQVGIQRE